MTRVSSAEQEERHSFAAQQARLLDYCKRKNLEIIKILKSLNQALVVDVNFFGKC